MEMSKKVEVMLTIVIGLFVFGSLLLLLVGFIKDWNNDIYLMLGVPFAVLLIVGCTGGAVEPGDG